MAIILIGPTCCGKSTLASRIKDDFPKSDLVFGFELSKKNFKSGDIVHYNLLQYHLTKSGNRQESDLLKEPIFLKIWGGINQIDKIIIIVTPKKDLITRASKRILIEENLPYQYLPNMWIEKINSTNFNLLYEFLINTIETKNVNYELVYSSNEQTDFLETRAEYIHSNLQGIYIPVKNNTHGN